jgi:hypothetical protein
MEGEQPTAPQADATNTGSDPAAATASEDTSPASTEAESSTLDKTSHDDLVSKALFDDDEGTSEATPDKPADEAATESEGEEEAPAEEGESTAEGETSNPDPSDPKEVARQAFERREAARLERQAQVDADQKKYVEAAEDEGDEALRQLQVEAYNNRVDRNTNTLINGFDKATATIDVFQNPTPEVQEFLDDAIDEFQARFVTVDRLGNPTEVRGDINQFLSKKAETIRKLQQTGAIKQSSDTAKVKSKTLTPPARVPAKAKSDPIMDVLRSDDD